MWCSTTWRRRACIRRSGGADPGAPAAELLRALGIEPAAEGRPADRARTSSAHLAELRAAVLRPGRGERARCLTQCETPQSATAACGVIHSAWTAV